MVLPGATAFRLMPRPIHSSLTARAQPAGEGHLRRGVGGDRSGLVADGPGRCLVPRGQRFDQFHRRVWRGRRRVGAESDDRGFAARGEGVVQAVDQLDRAEVVEAHEQAARAIRQAREAGARDEPVQATVANRLDALDRGPATVGARQIGGEGFAAALGGVQVDADGLVAVSLEQGGGRSADSAGSAGDGDRLHGGLLRAGPVGFRRTRQLSPGAFGSLGTRIGSCTLAREPNLEGDLSHEPPGRPASRPIHSPASRGSR